MPTRPYPILTVNEKAARSLRAGHPWVYGAETAGPDQPYQNGDIVDVVSHKGRWLGAGVIVNPGVTIGDRAVIASGSVVTRDIPADSLAAGVPAVVKKRLNSV